MKNKKVMLMLGLMVSSVLPLGIVNASSNSSYEQALIDCNQAISTNANLKKEYDQELANYDKEMAQYKSDMEQYQKDMEQYQKDLEAYNQQIETNKQLEAQNQQLKADYDAKMAQYQKDLEAYNQAMIKYNQAKAEYDKVIAQMEADKNKPGHISEAIGQGLTFQSEPNAKLTYIGGTHTDNIAKPQTRDIVASGGAQAPNIGRIIRKGEHVQAVYTNLENTTYMGKKITKMVNTFTLDPELNGRDQAYVFSYIDPTNGFMINNIPEPENKSKGSTALRCQTQFFDKNGEVIEFQQDYPAVISVASLNNNNFPATGIAWREEIVKNNFTFVPITGSIVSQHADGIYANEYTNEGNGSGNGFDAGLYGGWDLPTSPNFWRVAGCGYVNSGNTIDYTVYSHGMNSKSLFIGDQWTGYTTKVANNVLPLVPDKPVPPIMPKEPVYNKIVEPVPPIMPKEPIQPQPPVEPDYVVVPAEPVKPETSQTGVNNNLGAVVLCLGGIALATTLLIIRKKNN